MNSRAIKNIVRRMLRGGSYDVGIRYLRSANRGRLEPGNRFWFSGFRLIARKK
jgi:formylglycine-generating enzyme required for sulfatase activity